MTEDSNANLTAPVALKQWCAAERTVAIARRGRLAAQVDEAEAHSRYRDAAARAATPGDESKDGSTQE